MPKRIHLLLAGGTIACVPGPDGLVPDAARFVPRLNDWLGEQDLAVELSVEVLAPQLDSSAMGPAHWQSLIERAHALAAQCDALIILQGTDTMAYSTAALAHADLPLPVVFSGSQRPWLQADSDAPANLLLALRCALEREQGVWLAFGGRVLPAGWISKVDADADAAFAAPNAQGDSRALIVPDCRFDAQLRVLALRVHPGAGDWLAHALLAAPRPRGLVLECFGSGNLPPDAALEAALTQLVADGCVLVVASQCLGGRVQLGHYAAGSLLARLDALPAAGLPVEACLVRLWALLSSAQSAAGLRAAWPLQGEALKD